jgi:large subunit ribosomal protein L24
MTKLKLKLGDSVKVMTGKSKGHVGRIISIMVNQNRALVEGANMVSRHTKPSAKNQDGGIIKKESPINLSNLMLVDSKGNPSKVGIKIDTKTGKKNRYFKKTGELIK